MNERESDPIDAADLTLEAMASRRSHSAKRLAGPGPTEIQIERIFGSASSAPDHGNETPWRFVLIQENKRHLLGEAFANALHERDNNASYGDLEKAKKKHLIHLFLHWRFASKMRTQGGPKIPSD